MDSKYKCTRRRTGTEISLENELCEADDRTSTITLPQGYKVANLERLEHEQLDKRYGQESLVFN